MQPTTPPKTPLKFMLYAYRPVRFWFAVCLLCVFLATSLARVRTYLIEVITDKAINASANPQAFQQLWKYSLIFVVISLIISLLWRSSGLSGMAWIAKTKANINQTLFNYLSRHSVSYFHNRFAGSTANKISNVANGFDSLAGVSMWNFLPLFVGLVADMILTYKTHYILMLILTTWMVLYIMVNVYCGIKLSKLFYQHAEAGSRLKGKMIDSTSNISSVQTAPGVLYEQKYVGRFISYARLRHMRSWSRTEQFFILNSILISFFMFSMIGTALYLFRYNEMTIGGIVLVISLISALERSLFFLGNAVITSLQNYSQIKEGLNDILLPFEVTYDSKKSLIVDEGRVQFKDVEFSYGAQNVFSNLCLEFHPGEKVGLVGRSGSGKSTLVRLLLRQYNLNSGSIIIDGQDISKVNLDTLHKNITYVPQATELFHRTIFENIRYGQFRATEKEVKEAAKKAYADEFISTFKNKYYTHVGERGVKLSGGQRQRISIARAFLKNSPILVLDEATSALDSESEAAIQAALKKLVENKTVIAIAHRLSTLQVMDRIVVIDGGSVAESGTHLELLARKGLYSSLWERQVSGFIQVE